MFWSFKRNQQKFRENTKVSLNLLLFVGKMFKMLGTIAIISVPRSDYACRGTFAYWNFCQQVMSRTVTAGYIHRCQGLFCRSCQLSIHCQSCHLFHHMI